MAKKYRTGPSGIGRKLTPAEVDDNFHDSEDRETALESGKADLDINGKVVQTANDSDNLGGDSLSDIHDYIDSAVAGGLFVDGGLDATLKRLEDSLGTQAGLLLSDEMVGLMLALNFTEYEDGEIPVPITGGHNMYINSDGKLCVKSDSETIEYADLLEVVKKIGDTLSGNLLFGNGLGIDTQTNLQALNIGAVNAKEIYLGSGSSNTDIYIGTSGTNIIRIGNVNSTIIMSGAVSEVVTNHYTTDKLLTLNRNGLINTATGVGLEFEEAGSITGYFKTTGGRDGFLFKAPSKTYDISFTYTNTDNRSYIFPDASGTLPLYDNAHAFTNKTGYNGLVVTANTGVVTTGTWNGTAIANAYLANSTISGVSLGSYLANLTATDSTLTFSVTYNGSAATTIGISSAYELTVVHRTGNETVAGIKTFTSDYTYFGSGTGDSYFAGDSLNFHYSTNADSIGYINNVGYNAGGARFRNLTIGNGKGLQIMYVDGVNGRVGVGVDFNSIGPTETFTIKTNGGASTLSLSGDGGRFILSTNAVSQSTYTWTIPANVGTGLIKSTAGVLSYDSSAYLTSTANLTATDSTLTFSGTYNGLDARTIGLNLGNPNTWTASQDFRAENTYFGTTQGYTYISNDTLNFGYTINSTANGYINYYGYNQGFAQFRNLIIADGKGVAIATFTGSSRLTTLAGSLTHNGVFTSELASGGIYAIWKRGANSVASIGSNSGTMGLSGGLDLYHDSQVTSNIHLRSDGDSWIGVGASAGKLGIGTPSPSAYLHILGTNNNQFLLDATNGSRYTTQRWLNDGVQKAYAIWDNVSNLFIIGTDGSDSLIISDTGAISMYSSLTLGGSSQGISGSVVLNGSGSSSGALNIDSTGTYFQFSKTVTSIGHDWSTDGTTANYKWESYLSSDNLLWYSRSLGEIVYWKYSGAARFVFGSNSELDSSTATLQVNGSSYLKGNVYLPGSGTAYLFMNTDNTGTGDMQLQAGAGSAGYGGSVGMYSQDHATLAGYVQIGITASGSKFEIKDSGIGNGSTVFSVDRSGNSVVYGTFYINDPTKQILFGTSTSTDAGIVSDSNKDLYLLTGGTSAFKVEHTTGYLYALITPETASGNYSPLVIDNSTGKIKRIGNTSFPDFETTSAGTFTMADGKAGVYSDGIAAAITMNPNPGDKEVREIINSVGGVSVIANSGQTVSGFTSGNYIRARYRSSNSTWNCLGN